MLNTIVNADYHEKQGIVIIKKKDSITFKNPGCFRISIDAAIGGGISDPRNVTILKMFNLIDIGERAGSGIPNIFKVWKDEDWETPVITEQLNPNRVILSLVFQPHTSDKSLNTSDKPAKTSDKSQIDKIIQYLSDNNNASSAEIASLLNVSSARSRAILSTLIQKDLIVGIGSNKNRRYLLKK